MKFVFDLIGGSVQEPDLPSPLGGLLEENAGKKKKKSKYEGKYRPPQFNLSTRERRRVQNQSETLALLLTSTHD